MAILSQAQTEALLQEVGAVQPVPRLSMGIITWKDGRGRPVASARCEAILRVTPPEGLTWCAADPELAPGVPTVAIPAGLPASQPGLGEAPARGLAQLALAGSDAVFIMSVPSGGGQLFLAIYDFARGLELADRPSAAPCGELVAVRADIGPTMQIISITLEACLGWQDTGLDPVQLATRPLLLGFDTRLLWAVDGEPLEPPVPHLAFRHVEAGSPGDSPPFRYAPSPNDPPVAASGELLPLGPSNRMRFPDTPGRIEVCILHVDCERPVLGYQGYFRIMAMVRHAGPRDIPHRSQLDHIKRAPWEPGFDTPERLPDPSEAAPVDVPADSSWA